MDIENKMACPEEGDCEAAVANGTDIELVTLDGANMTDCVTSSLNAFPEGWIYYAAGAAIGPGMVGCSFLCMQEKGILHLAFEKGEIYSWKISFVECMWSNLSAQES